MDDVFLSPEQFMQWIEQVRDAWSSTMLDDQSSTLSTALGSVDNVLAGVSAATAGLRAHAEGGTALDAEVELAAAQLAVSSAAVQHQGATHDLSTDAQDLAEEIHQTDLDASAVFTSTGGGI